MSTSHQPTKEQEAAFKKVVSAINTAKKTGLHFFGLQFDLVAYTNEAIKYVGAVSIHKSIDGRYDAIPNLYGFQLLSDSGADDPYYYVKEGDKEKFE